MLDEGLIISYCVDFTDIVGNQWLNGLSILICNLISEDFVSGVTMFQPTATAPNAVYMLILRIRNTCVAEYPSFSTYEPWRNPGYGTTFVMCFEKAVTNSR